MAESVPQLTSAIASGDTEAFARLYRTWFDFALAEARRSTGRDEQFCLDAVQEAMMRVIRRMKVLDSEAALAAWLKTAVRNASIDLLRQDQRRRRREAHIAQASREAHVDVAAHGDTTERLAWLRGQLAQVDSTSARALDMRFRLNWTLSRIGSALRLKTGTVDGRINRTLTQLRAAAQEDLHD